VENTDALAPSGQTITNVLNTVIQSEALQNYQFVIEAGCTPSTLNDLEFCNSIISKNNITTSVIDQACVDLCNAAYDICHGGCKSVDWTCNDCCTKECKKVRDACKNACGYLTVKIGFYEYKIVNAKGLGALRTLSVTEPAVFPDDATLFSVNISMDVPAQVTSKVHYIFQVDGFPQISGDMTLSTTGIKITCTGTLKEVCGDGYYLDITSMIVTIPENIFDSNELTKIANQLMIQVSDLTYGIIDLRKKLLGTLNDTVSKEVMKALNDILDDIKIAPANC
jgi:hypothetical protein